MTDHGPAARAVSRARSNLLLRFPFFGHAALRLPIVLTDAVPTAATDGWSQFYNPDWVLTQPAAPLETVVAHEVVHALLEHPARREWREQRRFNDAADYAANDLLLRAGLQPVLGWLHNPAYARLGMETIYARLPAGPGSGGGLLGDVLVRTGRTPEEAEELRRRIREVMVDAREFARSQGRLPGYLDELVGRALAARVPWGNVLRRFMEGVGAGDYSWEHPDETMLGRDIVLPTLMTRRRVDHIVVAQDTSGSVSTEELRQCGGELSEILAEVDFGELHYIEVDTAVARVSTLERGDLPLELRAAGRGGTSFEPAFRWVEERDLRPSCLIYLTDMKGAFPERAPAYPVLWAALPLAGARPPQPPFGELVEIS